MARKRYIQQEEEFTVLVVDDQPEVLESVIPLLKREGYKVFSCQNGNEALEAVRNEKFDLMLLDYFMPGMTGEDVVREIRKMDREMFILLQTGYAGEKPPLDMLKLLDIQGYHDKTEGPDKLLLWVAAGIRSCAQMRVNKRMREGLTCILQSVPQIFRIQAFIDLLKDILVHLEELIPFENGFIDMEQLNGKGTLVYGTGRFEGLNKNNFSRYTFRGDLIEYVKQHNEPVHEDNALVIPILYQGSWMGMIYVDGCSFDKDEYIDIIKIYVNQAVEAIINMHLHEEVLITNEKLKESYLRLKRTYLELIEALTKAVDAKDKYTAGHSTRVSLYARIIGKELGMSKEELSRLKVASLFHDIGKIGIPDVVLLKEGKLTDEEFMIIKTHPIIGSKILAPVSMFADVMSGVKHHHEKYNGRGYPDGLTGEEIPLNARILAIADSFDAMTSDRSYRRRMSFEAALDELENCMGTQFDPVLAKHFIDKFKSDKKYFTRLISFWDNVNKFGDSRSEDEIIDTRAYETIKEYAAAGREGEE